MDCDSGQSLVTRTSMVGGLVGGLVHASVAVVLWNYWFDSIWAMLTIKPLNAVYLLLGVFLLGFVPVVFYVGEGVVAPSIVVAGCLFLAGLGSWLAGPVRAPSAAPTPFALYVLLWIGIVALAGVTGRVEYRRHHRATN